jgi:hypothetical protein
MESWLGVRCSSSALTVAESFLFPNGKPNDDEEDDDSDDYNEGEDDDRAFTYSWRAVSVSGLVFRLG